MRGTPGRWVWPARITAASALLALALTAGVRWWRPDSGALLIQGTALAGWLLLAGIPVALGALACRAALVPRATPVALAALLPVLLHLQWVVGQLPDSRAGGAPAGSSSVRVASANLLAGNPRVGALMAMLRDSGADVLLLQEVTPEHQAAISGSGLLDTYRYSQFDPLPGYHGTGILSRLPMTGARAVDVAGSPMMRAEIATPSGPLQVVNVHVVAPLTTAKARTWHRQLRALAALRPAAGQALVLAGDFNATLDHRPLARLVTGGMRDAHSEAGHGLGPTWPQGWLLPPPLLTLDHALVSEPLTVTRFRTLPSPGSDHRGLLVDLAVPRMS